MKAIVALRNREAMMIVAILEKQNVEVWQFSDVSDAVEFCGKHKDVGMLVIGDSTPSELQDSSEMVLALKSMLRPIEVVGISTNLDSWGDLVSAGCNNIITLGLSIEEDLRHIAAEARANMHIAWVA